MGWQTCGKRATDVGHDPYRQCLQGLAQFQCTVNSALLESVVAGPGEQPYVTTLQLASYGLWNLPGGVGEVMEKRLVKEGDTAIETTGEPLLVLQRGGFERFLTPVLYFLVGERSLAFLQDPGLLVHSRPMRLNTEQCIIMRGRTRSMQIKRLVQFIPVRTGTPGCWDCLQCAIERLRQCERIFDTGGNDIPRYSL